MSINGIPAQRGGQPLRCPTCGTRLIEVERAEVLIDACPDCRGVWLDRGELDKILVRERQLAGGDPDEDFLREVEGRRNAPSQASAQGYGSAAPSGRKPSEREAAELLARKALDVYKSGKSSKSGKKRKKGLFEQLMDF
ncbi:MAG TPA: zf-TFIIB domain-containing protein [Conexibacter sp.]|nr:zf-TFIIB domain-containing protein [Conexibacter sp.]